MVSIQIMNIDIDKNFDQLLKDKQIEYDQKQYDLVKVLVQKNKIFHKFTYKSSILEKLRISKRTPPKGMYIYGQVGRGKSMLMDLFFDSINIKEKRRVHFNEFMNEVHEEIFKWREKNKLQPSKEEDKDPILMVAKLVKKQCKLLCFDEFQVEDIADAMILGRLFKILFDMKILIIATSNIHPRDLYSEGLNRDTFLPFIDILEENMEIYHLDAEKDYRIDRLRDQTVYFSPNNKINRINYNEAWQKLKGSIEVINKILKVKGRDLIIPNSAGKYVKFTYDELCIKPLGVADYLEISKNLCHGKVVSILEGGYDIRTFFAPEMSRVIPVAKNRWFLSHPKSIIDNCIHELKNNQYKLKKPKGEVFEDIYFRVG